MHIVVMEALLILWGLSGRERKSIYSWCSPCFAGDALCRLIGDDLTIPRLTGDDLTIPCFAADALLALLVLIALVVTPWCVDTGMRPIYNNVHSMVRTLCHH